MATLNANALCSRKNVKDFLGIDASNNDIDNIITDIVNRVSTVFENYCGRKFIAQQYTEYYDGGSDQIFTKNIPIVRVIGVYDDSERIFTASTMIPSGDYFVEDMSIISDLRFSTGRRNVKVVYEAGYDVIPEDIKHVCILECARIFKRRNEFDITSVTHGDQALYFTNLEMLPQTKNILSYYRIIAAL